jgi:LEA14-like dessication related protein
MKAKMKRRTRGQIALKVLAVVFALLALAAFIIANSKKAKKEIKTEAKEELAPRLERVDRLKVDINYDQATITGQAHIHNPAPAGYTLDSIVYKILQGGTVMASGAQKESHRFAAEESSVVPLTMHVAYAKLDQRLRKMQHLDSMDLQIQGEAFLTLPVVGAKRFPINSEVRVMVPHYPEVKIKKVQVKDFGLKKGALLEAEMEVLNKDPVPYNIGNISYHLKVEDFVDTEAKSDQTFHIKGKGTSTVIMPMQIDVKEGVKTGIKKLFGEKLWNYDLKGKSVITGMSKKAPRMDIEFAQTGTVDMMKAEKREKKEEEKAEEEEKEPEKAAKKAEKAIKKDQEEKEEDAKKAEKKARKAKEEAEEK